jgi:hypothetical protein
VRGRLEMDPGQPVAVKLSEPRLLLLRGDLGPAVGTDSACSDAGQARHLY